MMSAENSVTARHISPNGADSFEDLDKNNRKRNVQTVATHEDKLRVMTWMLAEEQALLEDGEDKKAEKMTKGERMCLATRAIAQFPDLFRGSAQANYMKASRWWKESKEYIYETSGMAGAKKARTGRGRKTSAWTLWLQSELKDMIDLEGNSSWNNKDLLAIAKTIVDNSQHPEFNKDYVVPQRNCSISDLLNLRWIQVFKEKYQVNAARPGVLSDVKEAELLHHLATIRDTKGGVQLGKKEVIMMANQLVRDTQPPIKMDSNWYKSFCDRHPDLNLLPSTPYSSASLQPPALSSPSSQGSKERVPPRILKADNAVLVIDETKAVELFNAIANGQFNTMKSLLIQGASTEGCDEFGCTALLVATKAAQFNMVKVLLEFGAKTEATDENGLTALVIAATTSQFHIAKSLLESRANMEATNEHCRTPLMLAAERGDLKLVKLLVRMGANIEARDEDDNTPLLAAAKANHEEVVDFFVKKGANVEARNIDGFSWADIPRSKKGGNNVLI